MLPSLIPCHCCAGASLVPLPVSDYMAPMIYIGDVTGTVSGWLQQSLVNTPRLCWCLVNKDRWWTREAFGRELVR